LLSRKRRALNERLIVDRERALVDRERLGLLDRDRSECELRDQLDRERLERQLYQGIANAKIDLISVIIKAVFMNRCNIFSPDRCRNQERTLNLNGW
jgi:hypothetical protein